MTHEEKRILLVDLCARLPYGLKLRYTEDLVVKKESHIITLNNIYLEHIINGDAYIKPYLRSMSSMTEEERDEVKEICADYLDEWENAETVVDRWKLDAKTSYLRSEFYNSHHLDWNGLIEKGLALEAPEGMYNTKN